MSEEKPLMDDLSDLSTMDPGMSGGQFIKLKRDIYAAMNELERLQAAYRKETGVNYVKPIYLAPGGDGT